MKRTELMQMAASEADAAMTVRLAYLTAEEFIAVLCRGMEDDCVSDEAPGTLPRGQDEEEYRASRAIPILNSDLDGT